MAKIEKIEKGVLHLSGIDLVDGTPILDVKPYLPRYDALRDAKGKITKKKITKNNKK